MKIKPNSLKIMESCRHTLPVCALLTAILYNFFCIQTKDKCKIISQMYIYSNFSAQYENQF